jgi:ADP-heptose:LPS heptosyltransferase
LKEWPDEYWIKLINYLTQQNMMIFLTGAAVDFPRASTIQKQCFNEQAIQVVAGKYSLLETVKLLASCTLVISIDTGIMHIASALDCNLISLHGPTIACRWGPLTKNAIAINSNLACSPCLNLGFEHGCDNNKCMKSITVDKIIGSVKSSMKKGESFSIVFLMMLSIILQS